MTKLKVLVFIDWFLPAYKAGGPIKSIKNLIQQFSDKIEFTVVCSNKDLDGTTLDVPIGEAQELNGAIVYYIDKEINSAAFYRENLIGNKFDWIYFNSVFSWSYTLYPLIYLKQHYPGKIILAPRGMLGEGALQLKKLKKTIFIFFSKHLLFNGIIWHASTRLEAKEIKSAMGKTAQIKLAQNLSSPAHLRPTESVQKESRNLKLVYISRISPKKNPLFILQIIRSLNSLENLTLDIFGPIEELDYWTDCQEIIESDNRINYQGILKPNEVEPTLDKYHFYVLPSLNENFGHSIVEAINCGVPVLISNNTPWKNLRQSKVGHENSLDDKNRWEQIIKNLYEMNQDEYSTWVTSCYEYAQKTFTNDEVIKENMDLFFQNEMII